MSTAAMAVTLPACGQKLSPVARRYPAIKVIEGSQLQAQSPFAHVFSTVKGRPSMQLAAPLKAAANSTTLLCNLWQTGMKGIYSFQPQASIGFNQLVSYDQAHFNGGSAIVGNKMYGINYYVSSTDETMVITSYAFNTDTWALDGTPTELTNQYDLIAEETATDPNSHEVFGVFYANFFGSLEWGVIDYSKGTRTKIATANHDYVALGIAADGYAYGVSADGNLYKIDRATGSENLVGNTGVTISKYDGTYYRQSGEIDPTTNTFYWAAADSSDVTGLYTVDLSTGKATRLGSYDRPTHLEALGFLSQRGGKDAPADAQDLRPNFVNGSTQGTLSFTLPTKTQGGEALTGDINYQVKANGKDQATGTGAAGSTVTQNLQLEEGMNKLAVILSNSEGTSNPADTTIYVGYDTPNAPADVQLSLGSDRKATVTWAAPTQGKHNGYLGALKYDVYRIASGDTTKVAENLNGTSFSETLPDTTLSKYVYGVVAVNGEKYGDMGLSNGSIIGQPFEAPYQDDFNNGIDLYTVIDANNDGRTWNWSASRQAYYQCNYVNSADDWLISPPIKLKASRTYKVAVSTKSTGTYFPEKLEVKWGNANTVEGMTGEVLPETTIGSSSYKTYEKVINPTTDGTYYIGLHAKSGTDGFFLFVNSLSVTPEALATAPDSVTNLKAVADQSGDLKATITFNAPTKAINGTALSALTKIVVKSGNRTVGTLTAPQPGQVCTVTDENASLGNNTYDVMPYNDSDAGVSSSVTVKVGPDVPGAPLVKAIDYTDKVKLDWDDVAGANGGIIIPKKVTYNIYELTSDGYVSTKLGSTLGGVTEYMVSNVNTATGDVQQLKQWAVSATNAAGTGSYGVGAIVVGKPYTLPFHNSFKDGSLENQFIGEEMSDQEVAWTIGTESSDNDGGCVSFAPEKAGKCVLYTGKINMKGAKRPKLVLSYKGSEGTKAQLSVALWHKDGTKDAPLWTNDFAQSNNDGKWHTAIIDIPTDKVSTEDYVLLRIEGNATEAIDDSPLLVDNINVIDPVDNDAAVQLTAPESVKKGQTASVTVKVVNNGLNTLTNPELKVNVDGKTVIDSVLNKQLALLEVAEVNVEVPTTTLNNASSTTVSAQVTGANDSNADNNSASAVIKLQSTDNMAPTNLTGDIKNSHVTLTWKAPATQPLTVTDDMESYTAWSTEMGDWTLVDGDKGYAHSLSSSVTYPHQGSQFAFMVWQPDDYFNTSNGLAPHSGKRAAVAIYATDAKGNDVDADNWMISPLLSGKAQDVTFWVNAGTEWGNEDYDVLYSTNSTDTASFVKIGDSHNIASSTWQQVTVSLPEGARHFAIHNNTDAYNSYLFMVDDVTYEKNTAPLAYRVYRDGALVATVTDTTFTETEAIGDNAPVYKVTAVYADGSESLPVELSISNGIETISATAEGSYNVYTTDGALVRSQAKTLEGLQPGIYIVNGKKHVVRR